MFSQIGLIHYLIFSFLIFVSALAGVLVVKNLLRILLLIEIMFCSVVLNFISFANYFDEELNGMTFGLFIAAVSAAQLALGVAILFKLYKNKKNIEVSDIEELNG